MIKAEVLIESNNWKKIISNPKNLVSKVLKKFPDTYKFRNKIVIISILLTNNKRIQMLNKKFRNKNKPTDILSFPFFDKKNFKKIKKNKKFYLGDLVISHEEFVKKNKKDFKNSFIKIFIHGFLHLLNYDHKLDKDYNRMHLIETNIFKKVQG